MKYGQLNEAELQRVSLKEGDLLLVRTNGSADLVGRCAVVSALPETMAFASYLIRLRCDSESVNSEFLQLVLRQQRTSGQLFNYAKTTVGQFNVSLGRIQKTGIPVPPLKVQAETLVLVKDFEDKKGTLRRLQQSTQAELAALLPAVLDKAFRGEL